MNHIVQRCMLPQAVTVAQKSACVGAGLVVVGTTGYSGYRFVNYLSNVQNAMIARKVRTEMREESLERIRTRSTRCNFDPETNMFLHSGKRPCDDRYRHVGLETMTEAMEEEMKIMRRGKYIRKTPGAVRKYLTIQKIAGFSFLTTGGVFYLYQLRDQGRKIMGTAECCNIIRDTTFFCLKTPVMLIPMGFGFALLYSMNYEIERRR